MADERVVGGGEGGDIDVDGVLADRAGGGGRGGQARGPGDARRGGVLAVDEAVEGVGQGGNRGPVELGLVVGRDDQGRLGDHVERVEFWAT